MPKYMVLYKANPSTWPTDPKALLAFTEKTAAGADMLLKSGAVKEIGAFNSTDGYAMIEAESKVKVIEIVAAFNPFFSQEIHEIVPWAEAQQANLRAARQAAASS